MDVGELNGGFSFILSAGKLRALEMLAGAPNRKVFTVKEIETILCVYIS